MKNLKYTYSQLSSDSVCHEASLHYELSNVANCKFYVLGLHDNYLIDCEDEKYFLRIYRNDWRSPQEIQFELELLTYLDAKGVSAGIPLATKAGKLSFSIDSPEGKRTAALFSYADGHAPGNKISVEESALLGKTIANVHQVTETFETNSVRQMLDIPYLLDASILAMKPFIDAEALGYITSLQSKLNDTAPTLPKEAGVFGICLGDVNPTNFHINDRKEITLFDLDQCGYGYRSFEIGKFISSVHASHMKGAVADAFLKGYQQLRQLSNEELLAIPYFEILSVIWVTAIHAYNVDRIGHKYLEKPFWDRRLAILKELDDKNFAD